MTPRDATLHEAQRGSNIPLEHARCFRLCPLQVRRPENSSEMKPILQSPTAMGFQPDLGRRPSRRVRSFGLAMFFVSISAVAAEAPQPRLADFYEQRIAEIEPIAVSGELQLWNQLVSDDDRERFLRGFWRARPAGSRSAFRRNLEDARRYGLRSPAQRRAVHVLGKPSVRRRLDACGTFLRRLEIWDYDAARIARQRNAATGRREEAALPAQSVVFVQETNLDPRSYRIWTRRESDGRLVFGDGAGSTPSALVREALAQDCVSPHEAGRLRRALEDAPSLEELVDLLGWRRPDPWWQAERPLGAPLSPASARIEISSRGSFFRYTLVEGRVEVRPDRLRTLDGREMFDQVVVLGDVYSRDRLVDGFRVVHHLAGARPQGDLQLDFYRRLIPGDYLVDLRVEDGEGRPLLRERRRLEIQMEDEPAAPPPGRRRDFNELTRADVVFLTVHPSIEIVPPESFPVAGAASVRAVVRGLGIAAVRFRTASGEVILDEEAPFQVEVTFEGRRSRLVAEALDGDGAVRAEATAMLRRDARPFRIRFTNDAPSGDPGDRGLEVQVPEEETLAEIVCFHNGSEVARDRTPVAVDANGIARFACPPSPPRAASGRLRFERAVARLVGGEEVEAVFFPDRPPEGVDVRLAELFVSVFDRNGLPVNDLGAESVSVFEEGERAEVVAVRPVERLPLSVSVMMDLSSSMGRRVRLASAATRDFYDQILRQGDLASLFAFQHDLLPLADFSGRGDELSYAVDGLRAGGGTRLWDGLVFNLNSFVGLPARRAAIVLSDGADTESDATVEEVAQALRLSGVLLFPVSIGTVDEATRTALQNLARGSGGRWFEARTVSDLASVYAEIERILRGQVQITYRPLAPLEIGYRPVEVRVVGDGLSVRGVRGTFR